MCTSAMSVTLDCRRAAFVGYGNNLSSYSGDSGNKIYKGGYGGAYGGAWQGLAESALGGSL